MASHIARGEGEVPGCGITVIVEVATSPCELATPGTSTNLPDIFLEHIRQCIPSMEIDVTDCGAGGPSACTCAQRSVLSPVQ